MIKRFHKSVQRDKDFKVIKKQNVNRKRFEKTEIFNFGK